MLKSRTILLVDDNAISIDILFDILDDLGHRVLVAENGEAALKRCQLAKPDVIFMNSILPGIDGFDCCRQIKANKDLHQTPIVIMADENDRTIRTQCFKSGACAYIATPVISNEVSTILKDQLELLDFRENIKSSKPPVNRSSSDFDLIVDLIAHDMKGSIASISGFAELLSDLMTESEANEQWMQCIGHIHKSANEVDVIVEALVLLKNLRGRESQAPESIGLDTIFTDACARYNQLEYCRPFELTAHSIDLRVTTQPALLEELILILFRTFSNFIATEGPFKLSIHAEKNDDSSLLLRLNANTRAMSAEELPYILETLQGNKRKKVIDGNILLLCAQKLIKCLGIKAWSEHGVEESLTVCLTLESK
ncbi:MULTISPECIES: response regulator [unclassified Lentimonas]|uniref:ATP-binding response regulator n=1 Tax=unclassified Lentimonas TaxID=2630993 RepID=UPI001320FD24|nr:MULTISPECIES: response regulator [unclassified Lentimonas]CAA6678241.1 Unannotated [Lentimonas sp. CC4]CAA6684863.1 Unannotated [Lentimonas sp. CC6]CAA7076782.1 Unannotated [Lentimonas sp. CC4]CAA7170820.1 Unannotated [Lentimonas sp. CC21]CAA7179617.1 Unannotated [Lentimonas sp. CC8]